MNKKLSLGNYSIKENKIIRFAKTPKGRFFAVILCFVFFLAVSINPFEKNKNSNVWADQVSEFINLDQGLLPASGTILVNDNGVASPISSPLFVSSENLATLMQEDTNSNQQNDNSIIKYTVQKGETISEIAEKFSISTETILLANELSSMKIKEGQELIILPISGIMHMVEKGETIESIAKQYGSDSERIAEFNNLNDKKEVYLGDLLIIPDGKPIKTSPIVAGGKKQEIDEDYIPSVAENIPQIDSVFIIPTKGLLTQGAHYSYTSGRKNYYTAVDIANDVGTPVVAAAAGTIQIVKKVWPYGNYITILHDSGATTLYAHLSAFAEGVLPGQRVSQGQMIGYMGNTGHIVTFRGGNGSHLHFEVRGAPNPLARKATGTKISY